MTQKPIKLMQITQNLDLGGLQQVVYNICRTIDRKKFEVSVLCLRERGIFADDIEAMGIPVYVIEQSAESVDYFVFRKVAKVLRDFHIDVVHTHNTQAFIDGTIGGKMAGVKTVIHTDHAREFPDKIRYMIAEWLMSKLAYKVVGCSEHTTQQLIHYEKISRSKIVTIPNGIDGERFNITIDRHRKRLDLGILNNGHIVGVCTRLSEEKGVTFLLQAMPAILAAHPETTLLIIGDGEERANLESEAARLEIAEHIIFCGPRKDVPELFQIMDLYALPSKREGLPMVILEAMAAHCAIVATAVGGNATAIIDGENGRLVPPQDPAALATAVIELLFDDQLRATYSKRGYELFQEKFSASKMIAQYEKLYLRQI